MSWPRSEAVWPGLKGRTIEKAFEDIVSEVESQSCATPKQWTVGSPIATATVHVDQVLLLTDRMEEVLEEMEILGDLLGSLVAIDGDEQPLPGPYSGYGKDRCEALNGRLWDMRTSVEENQATINRQVETMPMDWTKHYTAAVGARGRIRGRVRFTWLDHRKDYTAIPGPSLE
jgi:hypothetical protein